MTPPRSSGHALTVLLGALAAMPLLGIDMGLPGLHLVERDFSVSTTASGQTLSLFLAGFAVAQLVLGPLSDRLGRRRVLLGGLMLYTLACLACALAPGIAALEVARLIAGAGAASGTVMALSITRDLFDGMAARRRLAAIAVVLSVAPVVAPTFGGWLLLLGGWRAIYAALATFGMLLLVAVLFGLPETRRAATPRTGVLRAYARVLRHPVAARAAWVNALNYGCMFAYVSGSPLVLMGGLGVTPATYGVLFALTAGGILAGAWLNGRLAVRGVPPARPLSAGLLGQTATAAGLLAVVLSGRPTLLGLMPLLVLNTFCRGLVAPNATHAALEPLPQMSGVAAAVVGALQMAVGAVASGLVAVLSPHLGVRAMCLVMLACAGAALLVGSLPSPGYAAPREKQA